MKSCCLCLSNSHFSQEKSPGGFSPGGERESCCSGLNPEDNFDALELSEVDQIDCGGASKGPPMQPKRGSGDMEKLVFSKLLNLVM